MLRTAEITAELELPFPPPQFHSLHWLMRLDLSLDCFICERTGRTTRFTCGEERATCTGNDGAGHPAAARIAGFDITSGQDRLMVRSDVDHGGHRATTSSATSRRVR